MNEREEQELDLNLMYLNASSLAKKGEVRQYKKQQQPRKEVKSESYQRTAGNTARRNPYLTDSQQQIKKPVKKPVKRPENRQSSQTKTAPTPNRRSRQAAIRRRKILYYRRLAIITVEVAVVILLGIVLFKVFFLSNKNAAGVDDAFNQNTEQGEDQMLDINGSAYSNHPEWEEKFLTVNEYSRPGDSLTEVNNIFVHYTANQGTSAKQNRSYFENLKDTRETSASAHFIIGFEGEIIQCVPLDEIAYAVQTRNEDSISIECCYLSEDGAFTEATYDSLIKLLAWLVKTYNLDADDILRHYDCGGKKCPIYYVHNEHAWQGLIGDVKTALQ